MPNLWLSPRPLVLASKSQARRALLAAAGIPFEAIDSGIDERRLDESARTAGAGGAEIAALLARAKATNVGAMMPDRLVLGADQTLVIDGALMSKPSDLAMARAQLLSMSARTHTLYAALCLVEGGEVVATGHAEASLSCRAFTPDFVDCYLDLAGSSVLTSVGGYAIEGLGIHLFETVVGEHSTILGLPMLELLRLLRGRGVLEV